jgi:translocation and assembly module TamA
LARRTIAFAAWALCLLATAAPLPAVAAPPRAVQVRGPLDKSLRGEIEQAIGRLAAAPKSRIEARRRANEAGETAIAVLRSEGYYDYKVEPDIGEGDTPQPFITVTPGPRTKIAAATIQWIGDAPAPDAQKKAETAMKLPVGQPGRASDVLAAEGRIVAALHEQGYADAAAQPREVVVDHADASMQPTFKIASGHLVRLGAIKVETSGRTHPGWVTALAPWRAGQAYRPTYVAELERRLRDTGVYDEVTVSLAPAAETQDGERPVVVSLADRPKGALELGASYATSEGVGVDSRWLLYNLFGRADTLTNTFRIADIDSRLQTELALPDWRKTDQTLTLTAALYRDNTPAYDTDGVIVSADQIRRWGKLSFFTLGVSVDTTNTTDKEAANFISLNHQRMLVTPGLLAGFEVDHSNDPLNPTSGWRVDAQVEPKFSFGDGSIAYVKASGQASAYMPLNADASTVIAARFKLGTILGGNIPLIPAQERLYAGGGGSVRGFGYQEVGPRYADNTPEGGLSLVEGSVEVRQKITERWGVVAFVDAGTVATQVTPDFREPEVGAGVGVRYDLGFGPIRLDVAMPVTRRSGDAPVQLYISIGQSF